MNRVHCQLKGCEGSLVVSSLEKMTDCSDCGYRLPVELVNNYLEIRDYCDQEIERMKDFSCKLLELSIISSHLQCCRLRRLQAVSA